MSGMEPMMIGAAVGAAANRKNPLQGAMLGGVLGGAGGAFTGLGSAAAPATTGSAITAGAGGTAAGNLAAVPAYGAAPFQIGASAVPEAGIFSNVTAPLSASQPLSSAAGQTAGLEKNYGFFDSLLNPSIESSSLNSADRLATGERFKLGDVGQFAQQNPVLTQMAYGTARDLLRNDQPQLQSPGLMRGTQMQVAAPQYQVGVPKVSLI